LYLSANGGTVQDTDCSLTLFGGTSLILSLDLYSLCKIDEF
jgi:hypothetical protein